MSRLLSSFLPILMVISALAMPAPTPFESRDMPVLVLYCDKDPGTINPGGGRGLTEDELEELYGCSPAEDVELTFTLEDNSWFTRCAMDENGRCSIDAPTGLDNPLNVGLHESTVRIGYHPAGDRDLEQAINYTEFAGYGLVLVPIDPTASFPTEHQTLAFSVEQFGKPDRVLTQLSEAGVTSEGEPWLATNDDGWVSYVLNGGGEYDLRITRAELPPESIACKALDDDVDVTAEWVQGEEGSFVRIDVPRTMSDINCEIVLPEVVY